MSKHVRIPLLIAVVLALGAASTSAAPVPVYKDARQPVAKRVSDLLSRMTLEDKVGQMTQAERMQFDKAGETNESDNDDLITTWRLGSILSGGGSTPAENTPKAWADMVDRYQRRALATPLGIPLIYGIDSVHGDGNMLGATVFPHNIGLGATRDPGLVREVEHITASETRSTGPQWSFAPCICAARDDRWGRTYESFSEDPRLVEKMETAIDGFQGSRGQLKDRDRVLATAKHYAGDGDTRYGTGNGDYTIDQGITVTNRRDFWNTSLRQYLPAVQKHHVGSVMPSYSSVDWTEDGVGTNVVNMHGNRELITDVLKGKMRLRRLRDQRLRGPQPHHRRPHRPERKPRLPDHHRRQRRHRHDHGAQQLPGLRDQADPARQGRRRPDEPDRRRRQPHPHQEVRARPVRASVHEPRRPRQGRLARRIGPSPAARWRSRRCC